jgi:hypothetical protein
MKRILRMPLLVVSAYAGCTDRGETGAAADVAHDVLTVDFSIGRLDEARPEYEFGRISGLTLLADGRVAMADALNHAVRIFEQDGTHSLSFGRSGAGPGEFDSPCCIAVDDRQRLWVRDNGNARYSIFEVARDSAAHVRQVRMAHGAGNLWAPVTFDDDGNVIDIGARSAPGADGPRTFRMHLDSTGSVAREQVVHKVPDDSTSVKTVRRPTADGSVTFFGYQPFGPNELTAHSPNGEFAHALSSRYTIEWRAADGTLIRTLTRAIAEGPALSVAERATGEERMAQLATRLGVGRMQLGFDVPPRKPVLRDLFFDRQGRLWVERQVPDAGDSNADVYGVDGTLERTVSWPAHVSLADGAIRGAVVWGVGRDSLDVPSLVRLNGLGTYH